jgi:hypothetical protein
METPVISIEDLRKRLAKVIPQGASDDEARAIARREWDYSSPDRVAAFRARGCPFPEGVRKEDFESKAGSGLDQHHAFQAVLQQLWHDAGLNDLQKNPEEVAAANP